MGGAGGDIPTRHGPRSASCGDGTSASGSSPRPIDLTSATIGRYGTSATRASAIISVGRIGPRPVVITAVGVAIVVGRSLCVINGALIVARGVVAPLRRTVVPSVSPARAVVGRRGVVVAGRGEAGHQENGDCEDEADEDGIHTLLKSENESFRNHSFGSSPSEGAESSSRRDWIRISNSAVARASQRARWCDLRAISKCSQRAARP